MAKQRKVVWTPSARADEIIPYIAKHSPTAALAFLEERLNTAGSLTSLSERGRVVPELEDPDVRELFIKSYRLFYEIQPNTVNVLGVVHGAREFKNRKSLQIG